jgi:hypothetical protein
MTSVATACPLVRDAVRVRRAVRERRSMPEADVEQLHELMERARAICELARVATHYEVAEALRPDTLGAALRTVEDLLGHALTQLPRLRPR